MTNDEVRHYWSAIRDQVEADCQAAKHRHDVFSRECPSRKLLDLVADKWTMLILPALSAGPRRNNELMRMIQGISQKMLTQTVRELERNGLVKRRDYSEVPPRVEYSLTELGRSLAGPLEAIDVWVEAHFHEVEAARFKFDGKDMDSM